MSPLNGSDENKRAIHRLLDGVNARDLVALEPIAHAPRQSGASFGPDFSGLDPQARHGASWRHSTGGA